MRASSFELAHVGREDLGAVRADDDRARAFSVVAAGSRVFVTGYSYQPLTSSFDYATVAYEATTGALRWVRRYNPADSADEASSAAASPDGSRVFVTGNSGEASYDFATIAYEG